jgi:hypothetical protein
MTQAEQTASSNVCSAVFLAFNQTGQYSYVQNYYGSQTQSTTVYSETNYCDAYYNFATVFYKGHSLWDTSTIPYHYYLYDNDGGGSSDRITDGAIAVQMTTHVHDFVFLWSCGMANDQGVINPPIAYGMSACWLYRDDLSGYHGYPDYTDHCFISFVYMSPDFTQGTQYNDHTVGQFVTSFYGYATDGQHTIDMALDQAANSCFGCNFESTWMYTGYWYDNFWCYIAEWGDGSMMLVS